MNNARQWSKKIFYGGLAITVLGIIIFVVQNKDITTFSDALLLAGYVFSDVGGCAWLFLHSLIGFRTKDIVVTGDEVAPKTRYRGKAAQVYGVIGMMLAVLLFIASIIPVIFII